MADNWSLVSTIGPSFEGGSAPSPTNPNNLAITYAGASADKETQYGRLTFDALTSPTIGMHPYVEDPDQSSATAFSTDGTTPADGTHPTYGEWHYEGRDRSKTSPIILSFKAGARAIRIYGNPYTAVNEPTLVRAGLSGATPSVVLTLPDASKGPVGNENCNDITSPAIVAGSHIGYMLAGTYCEDFDLIYVRPSDPRWSGVWIQVWIKYSGVLKLHTTVGSRNGKAHVTLKGSLAAGLQGEIRFLSYHDALTTDPSDDNINTYVPGYTPMLPISVGKSDGKTVDATNLMNLRDTELEIGTDGKLGIKGVDFSKGFNFATDEFEIKSGVGLAVKGVNFSKGFGGFTVGGTVDKISVAVSGNNYGWIGYDSVSGYGGAWFKRCMIGGTSPANAPFVADSSGNVAAKSIYVYDTSGAYGWIGSDPTSSYFGAWFKRMMIGGTSPATAQLIADSSGNLAINNAAISVTAGSDSVSINATDGIKITNSSVGTSISFLNGYLAATTTSDSAASYLSATVLDMRNSLGQQTILATGSTGELVATSFRCGSRTGATGTFLDKNGNTIRVDGGLITGTLP